MKDTAHNASFSLTDSSSAFINHTIQLSKASLGDTGYYWCEVLYEENLVTLDRYDVIVACEFIYSLRIKDSQVKCVENLI